MTSAAPVLETSFSDLRLLRRGKVRDVYGVDEGHLLIVATDRISGSGWKDYKRTGEVCGHKLPEGLRESEQLPEPFFTPATKAEEGHDENISEAQMTEIVGPDVTATLRDISLRLYKEA